MNSSQKGQITIEAVLILAIFVSIVYAGSNVFNSQQVLSKLVEGPWSHISGMIENAQWGPPQTGQSKHPNHLGRHGSPYGDIP